METLLPGGNEVSQTIEYTIEFCWMLDDLRRDYYTLSIEVQLLFTVHELCRGA